MYGLYVPRTLGRTHSFIVSTNYYKISPIKISQKLSSQLTKTSDCTKGISPLFSKNTLLVHTYLRIPTGVVTLDVGSLSSSYVCMCASAASLAHLCVCEVVLFSFFESDKYLSFLRLDKYIITLISYLVLSPVQCSLLKN